MTKYHKFQICAFFDNKICNKILEKNKNLTNTGDFYKATLKHFNMTQ